MSFGVFWCGLVWFFHFLVVIDVLLCDLGVIWFWMIWCDIIEVKLGLNCFVFGVIWRLLVWFCVICIFLVVINVFWCDLFLNDLLWYYWGQVRSYLVCFWCGLVSFDVVWCDFPFFSSNGSFWRVLGVILFWIIWCDIIEVTLWLSWFVFGVVWFLMVSFGVIFYIFLC